jgi:ABC-type Fe3+ transport system substrate-binding protein
LNTLLTSHAIKTAQFGSFVYNNESLKASDLPSTYDKLLDPFWKNKLVLTQPNDDDAITYLFSVIIEKYGWEWLEGLQKQNVKWVRGTNAPANYMAEKNTSSVLSFTTNLINVDNVAYQPLNDTRMMWPQSAAIFATTPRPESSKLFMSWLLSDEVQQQSVDDGSYLVRKDLGGQAGSVWDDPYTSLTEFATFMDNRELVEWWRFQFETSLGVAKGASPVDSFYGKMHA